MCFSASASFIAGGALSTMGIVTLTKARQKSQLPLASIPLLFGLQQIIEGFVWLSFDLSSHLLLARIYMMFSHVLWPAWVPLAMLSIEPNPKNKTWLAVLLAIGSLTGLYLAYSIWTQPITCQVVNYSLRYEIPHIYVLGSSILYGAAAIGSCLLSSYQGLRYFGVLLLASLAITFYFFSEASVSVWCFFAAILSIAIYFFLTYSREVNSPR